MHTCARGHWEINFTKTRLEKRKKSVHMQWVTPNGIHRTAMDHLDRYQYQRQRQPQDDGSIQNSLPSEPTIAFHFYYAVGAIRTVLVVDGCKHVEDAVECSIVKSCHLNYCLVWTRRRQAAPWRHNWVFQWDLWYYFVSSALNLHL